MNRTQAAVVTGSTSGIGLAIEQALARAGTKVIQPMSRPSTAWWG